MPIAALLPLILPALMPVVADGVRSVIGRFTSGSGALPQNVDDAIKLMAADTERMRVVAELDKPTGEVSRWVADLRASFRYIAAAIIILGTGALAVAESAGYPVNSDTMQTCLQMSGSVFSFMFGDRLYLGLKGKK